MQAGAFQGFGRCRIKYRCGVVEGTSWRHWALISALAFLLVFVVGAPGFAQRSTPCDEQFSDQEWEIVQAGSGVTTYATELDPDIAARFAADAEGTAAAFAADFGSFHPSTLCLFGSATSLEASELEASGLLPPGQRLHAAAFKPEATLFIDTQQFRLVPDAIALGLAEIGLWHVAGPDGYPEPLASAIAQWYVARQNDKLEQHRSTMRVFSFFNDPSGTAPPTDWFAGKQEPLSVWNPEFQESPVGDFVATAIAASGPEILAKPDPAVWAQADIAWRSDLRDELLQGADDSREWVGGVLLAVGIVVLALLTGWWGWRRSRRPQVPMGEIAVVDGFFAGSRPMDERP